MHTDHFLSKNSSKYQALLAQGDPGNLDLQR
jgi:hypothetical protein